MAPLDVEPGVEIIKETLLDDPKDLTSFSGTALGPSTSGPIDTTELPTVPFLLVIILQLAIEATDLEDISFGPITDNNAKLVQLMVDQFFTFIGTFLPIVLQDT